MTDFESSRSFQPDTDIVIELQCHTLQPPGDDDEFPTKQPAGIAVYNERDGDHAAHVIVFRSGGGVAFQTPLQAALLSTVFKSNGTPPHSFRLTSAAEPNEHVDQRSDRLVGDAASAGRHLANVG